MGELNELVKLTSRWKHALRSVQVEADCIRILAEGECGYTQEEMMEHIRKHAVDIITEIKKLTGD